MTLAILIKREKNGKIHKTHLKNNNVSMHLDIVERLVNRASRIGVRAKLIETIFENGYTRED